MKKKKVYLTLQNGDVFQGYRFGAEGNVFGELVFSTGTVGYVETLTDPSNYGKILVQTFPLIGNYGVMRSDAESEKAWASAYIVREYCEHPSNFRMEETLDAYLKEQGIVGIYGIDTRELTRVLREDGEMNAYIGDDAGDADIIDDLAEYGIRDAVSTVSPKSQKAYPNTQAEYTVVLWNFGAKNSTIKAFSEKGCTVVSVPATASAAEILDLKPDSVVISDGPGDPMENQTAIAEIRKLMGETPILGLGLGHQMMALAQGARTYRQKCGHHGGNQPVKCMDCGKVYVSAQNHSYTVDEESVKVGKICFVNVNDKTCEGIDYPELQAFSIQFAPESCDAGNVENPVYKKFFALMHKEN